MKINITILIILSLFFSTAIADLKQCANEVNTHLGFDGYEWLGISKDGKTAYLMNAQNFGDYSKNCTDNSNDTYCGLTMDFNIKSNDDEFSKKYKSIIKEVEKILKEGKTLKIPGGVTIGKDSHGQDIKKDLEVEVIVRTTHQGSICRTYISAGRNITKCF